MGHDQRVVACAENARWSQFEPFIDGWRGLLVGTENMSFLSGHTALAFATAASPAILLPRGQWLCYGWALLVAAERVGQNAHDLSDVVVGALAGWGCAQRARRFCRVSQSGVATVMQLPFEPPPAAPAVAGRM